MWSRHLPNTERKLWESIYVSQRQEETEVDDVNVGRVFQTSVKQISESLGAKEWVMPPAVRAETTDREMYQVSL